MKKITSIIATLMIAAIIGSVFAEQNYSITFRGMEWYSKYKDVYSIFDDSFLGLRERRRH